MLRRLILVLTVLLLAGCASDAFRASVVSFGETAAAAVDAQDSRLKAFGDADAERIRGGLATERVDLRAAPACTALLTGAGRPAACRVVRIDGEEIVDPERGAHIRRLGRALQGYAVSLALLARSADEEEARFREAVGGFGQSVGRLDARLAELRDETPVEDERLGQVAAVMAELGTLYFAQQRALALRRIVRAADPVVQDAVGYLSAAEEVLLFDTLTASRAEIQAAQRESREAVADEDAAVSAIRTAHDQLYDSVAAHRDAASARGAFAAIGAAHAALAKASRSGATRDDLRAAIERIAESGKRIGKAIKSPEGG